MVAAVGYVLQGVLASATVLAPCRAFRCARVVAVGQRLHLLLMTDDLFDEVRQQDGAAPLPGFRKLPGGFDRLLAAWSVRGPLAYVEADYFGGAGTQAAAVWQAGDLVLGPVVETAVQVARAEPVPISMALRRLGVSAHGYVDEFEAVGLGRHRNPDDWLEELPGSDSGLSP